MTRTTTVLAALGLLVASVIGGALVSGAIDTGEKKHELPPREDTIPVLAPSNTVPVAPGTSPTDVAAALVGGGGAGVADLGLSEPVAEVSPAAVETLREHASDASASGRSYGLLDLSTILLRFFDTACDEEHGEHTSPDGTCSTVLSLIHPPPFEILDLIVGPEAAAREECGATFDIGPEEVGVYPVLIISNNPADFTVTSGPLDGPLGEAHETSTDAEQVARWEGWLESDLAPGVDGREVHTCIVVFADPPVITPWAVHVDGTFGTARPPETDSADARFNALGITPETRPRPPVSVSPIDDNHVLVGIPAFGPRSHADAEIRLGFVSPTGERPEYPNTSADAAELCAATDPSGFREVSHSGPERFDETPAIATTPRTRSMPTSDRRAWPPAAGTRCASSGPMVVPRSTARLSSSSRPLATTGRPRSRASSSKVVPRRRVASRSRSTPSTASSGCPASRNAT